MTAPRFLTTLVDRRMFSAKSLMVLLMAVMLAAACTSTDPTVTPTPTPEPVAQTGTLDVRVTDQPDPDITAIVITAEKVQVHQAGADDDSGWREALTPRKNGRSG